jgi:hypothetical protein
MLRSVAGEHRWTTEHRIVLALTLGRRALQALARP